MSRTNSQHIARMPTALGLLCMLVGTPFAAKAEAAAVVHCADERSFEVELTARDALIRVGNRTLRLHRQASASMTRYDSADAALVIDGDYVAFVMTDALDFTGCHLKRPDADGAAAPVGPARISR